jgi:hypothetical protein
MPSLGGSGSITEQTVASAEILGLAAVRSIGRGDRTAGNRARSGPLAQYENHTPCWHAPA